MEFLDSHAHLDDDAFEGDREQIILEIKKAGITKVISAGYSLEGSKKAIELSKNMILFMQLAVFHLMIFHKQKKNCGKF